MFLVIYSPEGLQKKKSTNDDAAIRQQSRLYNVYRLKLHEKADFCMMGSYGIGIYRWNENSEHGDGHSIGGYLWCKDMEAEVAGPIRSHA